MKPARPKIREGGELWQAYVPRGESSLRLSQDAGITMVTCTNVAKCGVSPAPACILGIGPGVSLPCPPQGRPLNSSDCDRAREQEGLFLRAGKRSGLSPGSCDPMYCSFHKLSPVTQEHPEKLRVTVVGRALAPWRTWQGP